MAEWKILPAPIDKVIWAFLPCAIYEAGADGRPKPDTVKHDITLAEWDKGLQKWVRYQKQPATPVYMSMWSEVINPSQPPEAPELA